MLTVQTVPVLLCSAVLFLAMVMNLALKPRFAAKITAACMVLGLVGGFIFYGVGFAVSLEVAAGDPVLTLQRALLGMLRTVFCVIRMFIGVNEYDAIKAWTWVTTDAGRLAFWAVHVAAFYSMTSAVLTTIGTAVLRRLRLLLSRRGDLTLIYGINDNSISLAGGCLAERGTSVVFVTEQADPDTVTDLNNRGMSVVTGDSAVRSEKKFLKKLHLKNRTLTVYALHEDRDRDLRYALRLRDGLENLGILAEKTRITLPGAEDIIASMLQVSEAGYGFGYVNVYDPAELTARALIRTCPPWDCIRFGKDGRAEEDFFCVIVGFGSHGQEVLKQLIMNAQFAGSTFRAVIYTLRYQMEAGYLLTDSAELLRQYDISCVYGDGRGTEFFTFLSQHLDRLKMIAVCTGDDRMNSEISDNLMLFLGRRQAKHVCVVQCDADGIRYQAAIGSPVVSTDIYTRAFLSAEDADRSAILLNAAYDTSQRSNWEKWVSCDSFSKMSSRASAEFLPAFLRIAGQSRASVLAGDWSPDEALQQVLGETEHLRWCAFHYVMGYTAMNRERLRENALLLKKQLHEGGRRFNIAKDAKTREHACLVPWKELDELSEAVGALTGIPVDYKQIDINNVLTLPSLLQAQEKEQHPR